ncbi:MAG: methionine adenosyltransferase [Candidatus Eremiobacteraeota bacterium]|nr:methionine adenosyltransferase [Candidatus Eremiobacteraeota bacterium]
MVRRLFTSESVTEGHPDKLADQISDAVLDAILQDDPLGRVAVETFAITGQIHIAGEVTTSTYVDIPRIVRQTIADVGYTKSNIGFDADTCGVSVSIDEQSPDIAMGVDRSFETKHGFAHDDFEHIGAGDQGMMFGYACRETPELMPLPIVLAHKLSRALASARKNGDIPYLRPDGKSQVTIEYDGIRPVRVEAVVISTQHDADVALDQIRGDVRERIIDTVIPGELRDAQTRIFVNPTGRFVIGGPKGDAGLTGRKIIADTYGGMARHGGGAFSGKDPTKVDRSAAYAARHAAKNIVAAGLADRCELQVAYAIGVARPVGVLVETFGTGNVDEGLIADLVREHIDLRPAAIIHRLDLRRPIYRQTATYGHFGRPDLDLPWERLEMVGALRRAAGLQTEVQTSDLPPVGRQKILT